MTLTTLARAALFAFAAAFLQASAVSAQGADPPRVTASAAAGVAAPAHSDFGFTAPEWQVAIRA